MIRDRAAGIAPRTGDFRRIRALRGTQPGFDRAVWRRICTDGALGLRLPVEAGGAGPGSAGPGSAGPGSAGRGTRALCDRAVELGGQLAPEPLMTAAMAAELLPETHRSAVLAGERIVLPAWQEAPDRLTPGGDTALRDGRLSGRKVLIPMAAGADAFLVTLPTGLALVERTAPGLRLELQPTQDGGHVGTLLLDNARAEAIDGDATDALEACIVTTGAYLFGLMERACDLARDLHPTAQAAGVATEPQRQLADLSVQLSLSRSVLSAAAQAMDGEPRRAFRQAAVSRARLRVWDAAMVVTRICLQLQVGLAHLGPTELGLFLPKATALAPLYGSASAHRARLRAARSEIAG